MKDFEINGYLFRFDNGCLHLMRQAVNQTSLNPLEGLVTNEEIQTLIAYGGLGRAEWRQNKPISRTLEQCKELLYDFSPKEAEAMVRAWSVAISTQDEPVAETEPEGAEKKS